MTDISRLDELLEALLPVAREAANSIMDIYSTDFEIRGKADSSPVTEADERAEGVILAALARLTPDIPVVSEEQASAGFIPEVGERFWLVDPLDGTKEFISRNGEFTVNIALIDNARPVLGVVLAPAIDRLFAGAVGGKAFTETAGERHPIACRAVPAQGLTVVASRSHGDAQALSEFLAGRVVAKQTSAGSSLKLCLVATGEADVYPRLGRTMEWDIAAGDAVLRAAGGAVMTLDGTLLAYGKAGFANPHFAAWGLSNERIS